MIKKSKKKVGLKDQATVAALINDLEDSTLKSVNDKAVVDNKLKITSQDASVTINTSQGQDATVVDLHATGGGVAGVASVNGIVGDVGISGINPVIIGQTGNNVTVNVDTGVRKITNVSPDSSGNVQIVGGDNVDVSTSGNTLTISATGGGTSGVSSINNITGAVQVQAADSSITVTNSGKNINIKANGTSSTYRYESVSLMTYITNACFSQGISFKDFLVGKVPLYYPIDTLANLADGNDDVINISYPLRIAEPYNTDNLGLINAYGANSLHLLLIVYTHSRGIRNVSYDKKVLIELCAFRNVLQEPYNISGQYAHGCGMASKLYDSENWESVIAAGSRTIATKEVRALDMFGYSSAGTGKLARTIQSIQVDNITGGLDQTVLLVSKIMLDNITIVRKYSL
jgi:hypothetical protein